MSNEIENKLDALNKKDELDNEINRYETQRTNDLIDLDEKYKNHALIGNYVDHLECHVQPDLLLIYKNTPDELTLIRLGSHSELFGWFSSSLKIFRPTVKKPDQDKK